MISEYILERLKYRHEELYSNMVDIRDHGVDGVLIKLNDGQVVMYDWHENTVRFLPENPDDMSEEDVCIEFGFRFKKRMWLRGYTQDKLAIVTGMSRTTIGRYYRGEAMPSYSNLRRLADVLECSFTEFVYTGF